MHQLLRTAVPAGFACALAFSQAAVADDAVNQAAPATSPHTLTANVGIFSQYVFRGLNQTNEKPAVQGGFDYSHASGFYAGVWGSNISWLTDSCDAGVVAGGCPSATVEVDTYLGFRKSVPNSDISYDVGFLRYNYPGSYPAGFVKPDTNELYAALGYKWLTAKYSYSLGDTFGFADATGTDYIDLTANVPMGETGFTFTAHVGRQNYRGMNAALWGASGCTNDCLDYTDYKVGVSKDIGGYVVGLSFTNTNARAFAPDGTTPVYQNAFGRNIGRSEAVVSVARSF